MPEVCPFCESEMVVADSVEHRGFVEVVKKCVGCGFKAVFEKPQA